MFYSEKKHLIALFALRRIIMILDLQYKLKLIKILNSCKYGHFNIFYLIQSTDPIMLINKFVSKRLFSTLRLPQVAHSPLPFTGNYDSIIATRKNHFSAIYPHNYKTPLLITEGYLQYLYDHKGNRYLDLDGNGGRVSLGHSHPTLTKVISDQSEKIIHTAVIYIGEKHGEYCRLLTEEFGEGYDMVHLCNSIQEANQFSLTLAKIASKEKELYSYRHAYHGQMGSARNATNLGHWNSSKIHNVEIDRLPWPTHKNADKDISNVKDIFESSHSGKVGGVIFEPIQGLSGVHSAPSGYFKKLVNLVQEQKGLAICDESLTGFGRIGKSVWAHRQQGYRPDIITIGPSLVNGLPFGAVISRKQIFSEMKFIYFNTFACGHLSSRVGVETLKIIKEENLAENAENVGEYFLNGLKKVAEKYESIGEVRGKGLLIGFDVANKQAALDLMELARERQILLGRGGINGNTLLITPPLCITKQDVNYALQALEDAFIHLK